MSRSKGCRALHVARGAGLGNTSGVDLGLQVLLENRPVVLASERIGEPAREFREPTSRKGAVQDDTLVGRAGKASDFPYPVWPPTPGRAEAEQGEFRGIVGGFDSGHGTVPAGYPRGIGC